MASERTSELLERDCGLSAGRAPSRAGRSPRTWRGRAAPPPGPRPGLPRRARETSARKASMRWSLGFRWWFLVSHVRQLLGDVGGDAPGLVAGDHSRPPLFAVMVWRALHACGRSRAPASIALSKRRRRTRAPVARSGRRMFGRGTGRSYPPANRCLPPSRRGLPQVMGAIALCWRGISCAARCAISVVD